MIGLGKWQGTVNIQILKFSGDVVVTISDNGGEYNVIAIANMKIKNGHRIG